MQHHDREPHDGDPHRDDLIDETPIDKTGDDGAPVSLPADQPPASSTVLAPPLWYGTDTSRTLATPAADSTARHIPGDIPAPDAVTSDAVTSDAVTSDGVTSDGVTSDGVTSDGVAGAIGVPEDTGGPARQRVDQLGNDRSVDSPHDRPVDHPADQHADRPADHAADHAADEPVAGTGPSATAGRTEHRHEQDRLAEGALGPDASLGDIARAARSAFVGKDLLQSGPALWPFGRRARQRRARNRQAAEEARRRRARFLDAFDNRFEGGFDGARATPSSTPTRTPPPRATQQARETPVGERSFRSSGWRSVDRRTNAVVIACLTGAVLVVVLALVWRGESEPAADSEPPAAGPTSSSTPSSSTGPAPTTTAGPAAVAPQPPIPTGGVDPVPPRPDAPIMDPRAVQFVEPPTGDPTPAELNSPEGAMRAWLSRVCPFDFTEAFGAAERRAKPAMTGAGWATVNPDNDTPRAERSRASWDATVAARESGRCAEPVATISPEAPRSDASAIVIGAITRVVTTHTASERAPYVEQLSEVRIVRRGTDGLWRVDLAAAGG